MHLTTNMNAQMNFKFQECFPNTQPIPAEYPYGLIANKWLFETFKGQIGIIGAKEKLELDRTFYSNNNFEMISK